MLRRRSPRSLIKRRGEPAVEASANARCSASGHEKSPEPWVRGWILGASDAPDYLTRTFVGDHRMGR